MVGDCQRWRDMGEMSDSGERMKPQVKKIDKFLGCNVQHCDFNL